MTVFGADIHPDDYEVLSKICMEMFEAGVKFAEDQTVIVKPNRKIRRAVQKTVDSTEFVE